MSGACSARAGASAAGDVLAMLHAIEACEPAALRIEEVDSVVSATACVILGYAVHTSDGYALTETGRRYLEVRRV